MSKPARVPTGSFRVTVESTWGPYVPQMIAASSLRDLFEKAAQLPLIAWLPPDDEDQDDGG